MELLAPAGSFPAFEAALEAGADAVYVGAPGFNARALSRDFTFAEIGSMIGQAHSQGVKLYIAMNSLVKEDELPAVVEALSCFEQLRPDALIIQDLGLLYLVRNWFPSLVLHASTLLSVHNSLAAEQLASLGFERVVLARELTIDEMAVIRQKSSAEIEVFIHGAMCFSYSGLCMFSSLHGGKSSLRGQCVQPCRRHYSWQESGKGAAGGKQGRGKQPRLGKKSDAGYLFSMNDLCGVDFLPELRKAGVSCLKIEGRMKSASYVANTVAAYRMALDSMDAPDAEQEGILRQAHKLLDDAMARKRSSGFLLSAKPTEAVTPGQSGSSGRLLGRVKKIEQQRGRDGKKRLSLQLVLTAQLSEGDRLRLHDENSGNGISFTLRSLFKDGQRLKTGRSGQQVRLGLPANQQARIGRNFQGNLYKVDVGSRIVAEQAGRKRRQKLSNRRVLPDRGKVEKILGSLSWKRGTVADNRQSANKPGRAKGRKKSKNSGRRIKELPWWVVLARPGDLRQRLPVRASRIIVPLNRDTMRQLGQLAAKIKKYQARIIWQLPPVIQESDLGWYGEQINRLCQARYSRFMLGHASQYGLFLSLAKGVRLELSADYTLNLLNAAALYGAAALGLQGALFSLETEAENCAAATLHFKGTGRQRRRSKKQEQKMAVGMYVYGHPPLFTARLDSDHFQYQQPFVSPKEEQFTLEQRNGLTLARARLPFSLLKWQHDFVGMGIDFLVLDLTGGPFRQEAATVTALLGQGSRRLAVLSGNFNGILV
jgi:putative protease